MLLNNKVLEHLMLNNCGLEDDGITSIATCKISVLSLTDMTFCYSYLALCKNCTLITLEVGTNAITDLGAKLLGEMLKTNTRLEGLSLWQNDLTAEVGRCWYCHYGVKCYRPFCTGVCNGQPLCWE